MGRRITLSLLIAVPVIVALAAFASTMPPAVSPPRVESGTKSAPKSLADARVFMLLPDGKVEISDTWTRRIYRWDGQQWREVEVSHLPAPASQVR